jgi:hypothetical protein
VSAHLHAGAYRMAREAALFPTGGETGRRARRHRGDVATNSRQVGVVDRSGRILARSLPFGLGDEVFTFPPFTRCRVTEETALGREECDGCGRMMQAGDGFETDDGGVWCADCRAPSQERAIGVA